MTKEGKIIIPAHVNVWPHELQTAKTLASAGFTVEFLPCIQGDKIKSPDILLDGFPWEIKSPQSGRIEAIERNIRRACQQSKCVVLDTRRMKHLNVKTIVKESYACTKRIKSLKRLLVIVHPDEVLAIK